MRYGRGRGAGPVGQRPPSRRKEVAAWPHTSQHLRRRCSSRCRQLGCGWGEGASVLVCVVSENRELVRKRKAQSTPRADRKEALSLNSELNNGVGLRQQDTPRAVLPAVHGPCSLWGPSDFFHGRLSHCCTLAARRTAKLGLRARSELVPASRRARGFGRNSRSV